MTYEAKKQPDTFNAALARHVLTLRTEFIPLSQSRNAKEKRRTLNWRVTLQYKGRDVLTTDYSAGEAHCPSYKQNATMRDDACIAYECEHGVRAQIFNGAPMPRAMATRERRNIMPETSDVIHSLLSDAQVLDYSTYEEFARDMGYDEDSRKGESIYRACLELALKLRNGLGESVLADLREASQDY